MLVVKLQKLQKAPPHGLKIEIITRPKREHVTDKIQRQETFTISAVALKQTRGKDQLLLAKRKRTNPNFFKKYLYCKCSAGFRRFPRDYQELYLKKFPPRVTLRIVTLFSSAYLQSKQIYEEIWKQMPWNTRLEASLVICWFINNLCHNFLNVLSNAWSYISRDVCSQ